MFSTFVFFWGPCVDLTGLLIACVVIVLAVGTDLLALLVFGVELVLVVFLTTIGLATCLQMLLVDWNKLLAYLSCWTQCDHHSNITLSNYGIFYHFWGSGTRLYSSDGSWNWFSWNTGSYITCFCWFVL